MKLALFLSFIGLYSSLCFGSNLEDLHHLALTGLEKNIMTIKGKKYLRAGDRHFGSLWTRDFAYSIPGLLASNHDEVVRDHLQKLLDSLRETDGLVPRVLDNIKSSKRVMRYLTILLRNPKPIQAPLKTEYLGEHKTVAIDSNILVLRGALLYLEKTGDQKWWDKNLAKLQKAFSFYETKFEKGLIVQEAFGDWQDSVKRVGATFLTNLHYHIIASKLQETGQFKVKKQDLKALKEILIKKFFDQKSGLFKSHEELEVISLDGNLFALDHPEFLGIERSTKLYQDLKKHPLFSLKKFSGFASYPSYPKKWRSFNVKLAGLSHYHDKMYWSWLMAFSAKIQADYGDQASSKTLLLKLQDLAHRDGGVAEIYRPNNKLKFFKSLFYRSEVPFSWGSAYVLWALSSVAL